MSFSSRKIIAKINGVEYFPPPTAIAETKVLTPNGKVFSDEKAQRIAGQFSSSPVGWYSGKDDKDDKDEKERPFAILKGKSASYVLKKDENFRIGGGAFADVYYLPNLETGEWQIVKIFEKNTKMFKGNESKLNRVAENELKALQTLGRRAELITHTDTENDNKFCYLIMDLEEGENPGVFAYNVKFKESWDPEDDNFSLLKVYFLILTFQAIKELHDRDLIHRDIWGQNIIVNPLKATLIDVAFVSATQAEFKVPVGVEKYRAPELEITQSDASLPYTKATDIYAAGKTALDFLQVGSTGDLPEVLAPLNPLIQSMAHKDPQKRPTIDVALEKLKEFYNRDQFITQRKIIDEHAKQYKKNEEDRFKTSLSKGDSEAKLEFKHTNLQLLNQYINNAYKLYSGNREGFFKYFNAFCFFLRWRFITSDETKGIINVLMPPPPEPKKPSLSENIAPVSEQKPLEDEKRYEAAKKYVLENKNKFFAKLLYKNIFHLDQDVKDVMHTVNKKCLLP